MKHSILTRGQILILTLILLPWQTRALIINPVYDSSVTNQPNAAQIEAAYGVAVQTFESLYTNPITIYINVFWGSSSLGSSTTFETGNPSYSQLTSALTSAATTAEDSNAVASLPSSNPIGSSVWWIPNAELKALPSLGSLFGIGPTDPNFDGEVFFESSVNWTFNPTNRAMSGDYDFIAVAEHETSEVMGRVYSLNYEGNGYVPYDLFRFTNGVRTLNPFDSGVYFSINNGVTKLKYFNAVANPITSDPQDWMPTNIPDSYDYQLSPGVKATLSSADLTALDILGYHLNFTRPKLAGARSGNGNFQITFTNVTGLNFAVLASTNLLLPETNWVNLGAPAENPVGHYQLTDTILSTNKTRFYRVALQ